MASNRATVKVIISRCAHAGFGGLHNLINEVLKEWSLPNRNGGWKSASIGISFEDRDEVYSIENLENGLERSPNAVRGTNNLQVAVKIEPELPDPDEIAKSAGKSSKQFQGRKSNQKVRLPISEGTVQRASIRRPIHRRRNKESSSLLTDTEERSTPMLRTAKAARRVTRASSINISAQQNQTRAKESNSRTFDNDNEKRYKCTKCPKQFIQKSNLTLHIFTHADKETQAKIRRSWVHICTVCENRFRSRYLLESHLTTHSEARPWKCKECRNTYKSERNLNTHMKVHKDDRKFECNFCSKAFLTWPSLEKHVYCHTGERPFNCKSCGKFFARPDHLLSHRKRVHMHVKKGQEN